MKMVFEDTLNLVPGRKRTAFLEKAYEQGIDGALDYILMIGKFPRTPRENLLIKRVVDDLLNNARESNDLGKVQEMQTYIAEARSYKDQEKVAIAIESEDPLFISSVLDHFQSSEDSWSIGAGMDMLNRLGRSNEVKEYTLKGIAPINERRREGIARGCYWTSFVHDLYLRLEMVSEALDIRLEDCDFTDAITLAQKHLEGEELASFYRRVYDTAEGHGYCNGYPTQMKIAKDLLKDSELVLAAKRKHLDWAITELKVGKIGHFPLDIARELGTREDLEAFHEKRMEYLTYSHQDRRNVADAAREAYEDTGIESYAHLAMNHYKNLRDPRQELEMARIVVPNTERTRDLEFVVDFMN